MCLLLGVLAGQAQVQSTSTLVGAWSGQLDAGLAKLTLMLHLQQIDGEVVATLDSPDQGAKGIPCFTDYLSDDSVAVKVESINAAFRGRLDDGKLVGIFSQNGVSLPLELTPGVAVMNRPQHPHPP